MYISPCTHRDNFLLWNFSSWTTMSNFGIKWNLAEITSFFVWRFKHLLIFIPDFPSGKYRQKPLHTHDYFPASIKERLLLCIQSVHQLVLFFILFIILKGIFSYLKMWSFLSHPYCIFIQMSGNPTGFSTSLNKKWELKIESICYDLESVPTLSWAEMTHPSTNRNLKYGRSCTGGHVLLSTNQRITFQFKSDGRVIFLINKLLLRKSWFHA